MQDFFNWQGVFGTIVGVIGTFFALMAWHKSREVEKILEKEKVRLNEKVKVILTNGKEKLELPEFRRQEFTRNEIQGRLGTIPMKNKGERYSIEYTNKPEYYEQIYRIIEGSSETGATFFEIKCTDEELAQFACFSATAQKLLEEKPKRKIGRPKKS